MLLQCKTDILPEPQQALWPQLKDTPGEFVLYGGTAVSLRYGHRQSVDFDFFTTAPVDVKAVSSELPYIKNNPHDMTLRTNQQVDYTVQLGEKTVNVTFMSNRTIMPGAVNGPDKALDTGIKIASPLDLMACKIMAMHHRSEQKDFIDLGELIKNKINLQKGFEASVALARITPQGTGMLKLANLSADLQAKTLKNMCHSKVIMSGLSKVEMS